MTEVIYEVEMVAVEPELHPENTFPKIARVILSDGVEVSRGYPDFTEVASASPETIEVFFDSVSAYFREMSEYVDTQTTFNKDQYTRLAFLNLFILYYGQNFDNSIIDPGPGDVLL